MKLAVDFPAPQRKKHIYIYLRSVCINYDSLTVTYSPLNICAEITLLLYRRQNNLWSFWKRCRSWISRDSPGHWYDNCVRVKVESRSWCRVKCGGRAERGGVKWVWWPSLRLSPSYSAIEVTHCEDQLSYTGAESKCFFGLFTFGIIGNSVVNV